MATTADELIDRRQLRRKISFWRVLTFIVATLALLGMMVFAARDSIFSANSEDHIARIKITGVITNDEPMLKLIKGLKDEEKSSKMSEIQAQLDDLDRLTAALGAMTSVNKAVQ